MIPRIELLLIFKLFTVVLLVNTASKSHLIFIAKRCALQLISNCNILREGMLGFSVFKIQKSDIIWPSFKLKNHGIASRNILKFNALTWPHWPDIIACHHKHVIIAPSYCHATTPLISPVVDTWHMPLSARSPRWLISMLIVGINSKKKKEYMTPAPFHFVSLFSKLFKVN